MVPRALCLAVPCLALGLLAPGADAQCYGSGSASASGSARRGVVLVRAASSRSESAAAAATGSSRGARGEGRDAASTGRGRGGPAGPGCAITAPSTAASTGSDWARWWERHEDEFVWGRQRGRPSGGAIVSGTRSPRTTPAPVTGEPLRRGFVYTQVIGPLLEVIGDADGHDPRLRESAILALGDAVDARFAGVVTDTLLPCLQDDDRRVAGAAALALGLGRDPRAVPALADLALCSTDGHTLVGGGDVPERVRIAALLGLGFSGDPEALPTLEGLLEALPHKAVELKRAAVLALGLSEGERVAPASAALARLLADPRLDERVQSAVPTALARLGAREAADALAARLADRDTHRTVRQSCALALGRLGELADPGLVDLLLDTSLAGRDAPTRQFAALSLARLGAADARPDTRRELHQRVARALGRQLRDPEHRVDRPFYGLAAGLYLQAHRTAHPDLHTQLRQAWDDVADPATRGAYALGLGLAAHPDSGALLHEAFLDTKDEGFRGHCAVALGLLGHAAAEEELSEAVLEKGREPWLRRELGTALMLLDDPRSTARLVEGFADARSQEHRAGLALALSAQRSESVVPSLRAALVDEDLDALSRASACAALGRVAGRERLPWRARLALGSNPQAAGTPTVDDLLGLP